MKIEDLTNLEDLKNEWSHYLAENTRIQFLVLSEKSARVLEYLNKAKDDFRLLFTEKGKFIIKDLPKRIHVSYHELKFEIFFEEPNNTPIYEFSFSKISYPRINYNVAITPVDNIIMPNPFKMRDEPKTKENYINDINAMRSEYVLWDNVVKQLKEARFCYQCYNAENSEPDYANMKKYESFKDILVEKLGLVE